MSVEGGKQLDEMPMGLGSLRGSNGELYKQLLSSIQYIKIPTEKDGGAVFVSRVGRFDLKKVENTSKSFAYYMTDKAGVIVVGTIFKRLSSGDPNSLEVSLTAKNPTYYSKPPYATDLYVAILESLGSDGKIYSDSMVSDDGVAIWKKLVTGKIGVVSVVDISDPTRVIQTINNVADINKYYTRGHHEYKKYRFLLTLHPIQTAAQSETNRLQELAGLKKD